ncbi:NUDIX hydrolase [Rhodococcus opacus]|uniref:NUDIX domain-containing protein n=1 Tax=Rhodococcus opacus TaxID=37919 RepID=A0AAX3YQ57_RHOOP|nr:MULTISPECIES: NUDIX domain-containing protein [Rhodococcus]NHU41259.1 NUDIX domain-containing protein [Rhodococcus sp. A14]MBA8960365.1 8-oxo-dGTP pyrophosphatase MutT (NUDIX family) [Rhodococcus opacus]MBP2205930.1 8-oxo-dGTP pyrophosphatase MutT (NUDIX family) [Rhodococcus opacus]MCZ4585743.1 NUDIX domain-containing protein [Rhodococcus opacus]MDI9936963.1 NUDIX domain-containing protein [Rhodococcus sp. IEGM 1351]
MVSKQEQAPRDSTDVAPKDASTVILIRDAAADVAASGIEVFLLRRVKGMAFAGGMTVFPGGGVDPSDAEAEVDWAGPSVDWWAGRFSTDAARAKALVCAAVRETFEECGVLLAGSSADTVVADTSRYSQSRTQLEKRELSFSDFLKRENLVLRADLLRPWANWITPVGEGRRYDTRFFVAAAPHGQIADGATSEAEEVQWQSPAAALAHWQGGGSILLPPTWSQLTGLSAFGSVAEVLAAEPEIPVILPTLITDEEQLRVEFPGQDGYYEAGPHPWASRD